MARSVVKKVNPATVAEYEQLVREVSHHDWLYYVKDSPKISDAYYDRLYRKLRELEERFPQLTLPHSPTQRVGGEVIAAFSKVKHPQKMLSLDNTYDEEELKQFLRRNQEGLGKMPTAWVAEPKIDGLSIELTYDNNHGAALVTAATRGDGIYGEDVTHNIRTIRTVPLLFKDMPFSPCTVRGEIFIERSALEMINQQRVDEGEAPFKNCRNAAAGSVRLLDNTITAKRPLKFFAWGLLEAERAVEDHWQAMELLKSSGFPINPVNRLLHTAAELFNWVHEFDKTVHTLAYPTDGVVIKVNRFDQQRKLGSTSKYPRSAIAFKYSAEKAITQIKQIQVQVGRTGTLTPVAELVPVELSGTEVARASLHNEDEIARKDVRQGDWVEIEKAGEIIPQVVRVLKQRRRSALKRFVMPKRCPACGSEVVRDAEAVARRCSNRTSCPAQLREAILFFASRSAMNIEHLGPALVDQLLQRGLIKDAADLFQLRQQDLAALERMAEKSAENVVAAIEVSRSRATLPQLITGLGIPHVGAVAAGMLADYFGSLAAMLNKNPQALQAELEAIHGIGPVIAAAVAAFLQQSSSKRLLKKLLKLGIDPKQPKAHARDANLPLAGLSFCITGTLSKPRQEYKEIIQTMGGQFHSTVKKDTSYLVKGEGAASRKDQLAAKYGTRVITESDFNTLTAR